MIGSRCRSPVGFAHSDNVVDMVIWGFVALIVQIAAYYLAKLPIPDLSQRIAKGEIAPAIWLGSASVTAGLVNAASMTT